MRIAICEDDPLHAQLLVKMIAHWQKTEEGQKETVKTEIFLSAEQLLCSKEESFSFDLAFLDIGLKQMDGLELARASSSRKRADHTCLHNSRCIVCRQKGMRVRCISIFGQAASSRAGRGGSFASLSKASKEQKRCIGCHV